MVARMMLMMLTRMILMLMMLTKMVFIHVDHPNDDGADAKHFNDDGAEADYYTDADADHAITRMALMLIMLTKMVQMLTMVTPTSMLLRRSSWNLSSQSKLMPPHLTTVLALWMWSTSTTQ